VLSGVDAYAFLLRLASGLESEVVGETNVFGQVKKAWADYEATGGPHARELRPLMHRLFEDTKLVRSTHLQNLGSGSYGGLLRTLLRARPVSGPVLLVGAGDMAMSVSPWLLDHELWLWNRGAEALRQLAAMLKKKPEARFTIVSDEDPIWREAGAAVICIPPDSRTGTPDDEKRIAAWLSGAPGRPLIHLGCRRGQAPGWERVAGFQCLDDLFDIQKSQGESSLAQIGLARDACARLASERAAETAARAVARRAHLSIAVS
jgi:hypothetical protein